MAKNVSEWMLTMLETDPRFVGLDPEAAIVWLKIGRMLFRRGAFMGLIEPVAGEDNYSPWPHVAVAFRLSVPTLNGHIETLLNRRLLLRSERGGVVMPFPPGRSDY